MYSTPTDTPSSEIVNSAIQAEADTILTFILKPEYLKTHLLH